MIDVELDWQIEKCEECASRHMWAAGLVANGELADMYRHRAGEWTTIQNSLIELRNLRAQHG
jgi:hypothetical protein